MSSRRHGSGRWASTDARKGISHAGVISSPPSHRARLAEVAGLGRDLCRLVRIIDDDDRAAYLNGLQAIDPVVLDSLVDSDGIAAWLVALTRC